MPKFALPLALIAAMGSAAPACNQAPKDDPKVAQLEKELNEMKAQVAAAKNASAGTAAEQAAAATSALDTAKAAQQSATATGQAVADQSRTLADQSRALSDQKAATQRTAEENARLKSELEDMKPREFTIPAGTVIPVRTTAEVSTSKVKNGSIFDALLEKDLVLDDVVLAKAGAAVTCMVVVSDPGGRVKGVASVSVAARSIAGVGGNVITVKTESYTEQADSTKKRDAVRTGIATGLGAAIGAIAGGGKGAAIGAGAGAAAGVGTNAATRGEAAIIPTETLIEFTLTAPAKVVIRR